MGWQISLLRNDVELPQACQDAFDTDKFRDQEIGTCEGKLEFIPDHLEHMDYVWHADVQKLLRKHKVRGDICFGSLDGDNFGEFWGYRFDGQGGMTPLEGKLEFHEKK